MPTNYRSIHGVPGLVVAVGEGGHNPVSLREIRRKNLRASCKRRDQKVVARGMTREMSTDCHAICLRPKSRRIFSENGDCSK